MEKPQDCPVVDQPVERNERKEGSAHGSDFVHVYPNSGSRAGLAFSWREKLFILWRTELEYSGYET
jgi:hypothetical protein